MLLFVCLVLIVFVCGSPCNHISIDVDKEDYVGSSTIFLEGGATIERKYDIDITRLNEKSDGRYDECFKVDSLSVSFSPLESTLEEKSIFVYGEIVAEDDEKSDLEITNVQTRRHDFDEEEVDILIKKRSELEKKVDNIEREIEFSKRTLQFFETLMKNAGENGSVKEFRDSLEYYEEKTVSYQSKLLSKNNEIKEMRKQIDDLNEKIREVRTMNSFILLDVHFHIDETTRESMMSASPNSKLRFVIKYYVNEAIWYPSYTLRVDSSTMESFLDYYGNVQQWTSKDWNNHNIILSSARKIVKKPDDVSPIQIPHDYDHLELYYYSPPPMEEFGGIFDSFVTQSSGRRSSDVEMEFASPRSKRAGKEMKQNSSGKIKMTQQKRSTITDTIEFKILNSRNMVIKGNTGPKYNQRNNNVKLTIKKSFPLDSRFEHHFFPQYHPDTIFLKMKSKVGGEKEEEEEEDKKKKEIITLFPGQIQLMVDNQFLSTLELDRIIREEDEFEFWIGEDSFIEVKRIHPPKIDTKKTGGYFTKKFHHHGEEIEFLVRNNRVDKPITLWVTESLPHRHSSHKYHGEAEKKRIKLYLESPISIIGEYSIDQLIEMTLLNYKNKEEVDGDDDERIKISFHDYTVPKASRKNEYRDWEIEFGESDIEDDNNVLVLRSEYFDEKSKEERREYRITSDYVLSRKLVINGSSEQTVLTKYEIRRKD